MTASWKVLQEVDSISATAAIRAVVDQTEGEIDTVMVAVPHDGGGVTATT